MTSTRKPGMRRNMNMKRKRSLTNMITRIMTMIMDIHMITGITTMIIIMKKSLRRNWWLPRTYTCIKTIIIVMRWRAIIAIMIVGMTTITTMTMIMLIIKRLLGYQREKSSIREISIPMLILKGLQYLKPSKFR